MDGPANPATISRIDSRYRYRSQKLPQHWHHAHEQLVQAGRGASPGSRESMTRSHRSFHRRAAQGNLEVVTVEVVDTVDDHGKVVAQQTLAPVLSNVAATAVQLPLPAASLPGVPSVPVVSNVPAPALPSVSVPALSTVLPAVLPSAAAPALPSVAASALPTVPVAALPTVLPSVAAPALPTVLPSVPAPALPSVPAVPPFPTSLRVPSVPAYPFPTMYPVAHALSASASASAPPVSGIQSTATPSIPTPVSAIHSATNTTLSSTASLLPSSSVTSLGSASASTSTELRASIQAVPSLPASDLLYLPSSAVLSFTQTLITSHSARSTSTTSVPSTTTAYSSNGGGGVPGVGGAPVVTTSATSEAEGNSSPSALETPKVIGSVLGSLAGAALILALILLLLRRHKQRRGGALQLTGDERTTNNRAMSEAPTATSAFVPIAFLNRFSGMSGKTAESNMSGGERGFQRVSGRKLPSAFSEGMTSDQFSRGGTMSGSSFYQDDHGIYGGPGMSKEFGKEIGDTAATRESGQMNIRPSPARTPIIRHPEDENPFADRHHLSPPHSPVGDLPPRGTLGRSLPSADGSRSSKFTENV